MEPITVLILMLIVAAIAAVIASKRNRSGLAFFALGTLPVVPVMLMVSRGTNGDGTIMGWAGFTCPVIALIAAICVPNGKEVAVRQGSHGGFVRCPMCAEPVRREAVKCRHCAADLASAGAENGVGSDDAAAGEISHGDASPLQQASGYKLRASAAPPARRPVPRR